MDQTSELFAPDKKIPEALAALNSGSGAERGRAQELHPDIFAALLLNEEHWKACIVG